VIAVRVRVDQCRHRLVGERLDLVENRLAPAGVLRIDNDDAIGGDGGRLPRRRSSAFSTARLSLSFVTSSVWPLLLLGSNRNRQPADNKQRAQDDASFHALPPKGGL
jgi:hypothetical protein